MQLPSAVIDRIKLLWQCSPITTKTLKILCQALEALRLQRRQSVFAVWLRIMHFLSQQDDQAEMTSHNCSKSKFLKTKARFGRLLRPLARKRNGSIMEEKGSKGKEEYMYISKRSSMDHTVLPEIHHACLSFVSVHQMAPPLTEVRDIQLQLTTHLSTLKG